MMTYPFEMEEPTIEIGATDEAVFIKLTAPLQQNLVIYLTAVEAREMSRALNIMAASVKTTFEVVDNEH